jgi:hypothetical protein
MLRKFLILSHRHKGDLESGRVIPFNDPPRKYTFEGGLISLEVRRITIEGQGKVGKESKTLYRVQYLLNNALA